MLRLAITLRNVTTLSAVSHAIDTTVRMVLWALGAITHVQGDVLGVCETTSEAGETMTED